MKNILIVLLVLLSMSVKAGELITEEEVDTKEIKKIAGFIFIEDALTTNFDWSTVSCRRTLELSLEIASEEYFKSKHENQKKYYDRLKSKKELDI